MVHLLVESAVGLAKGRKNASRCEGYGGVVGLGGILGSVFPSLSQISICYDAVRMRGWVGGLDKVEEGGVERGLMAFVASEADRSLAEVFIAVLVGCLWTNYLVGCLS